MKPVGYIPGKRYPLVLQMYPFVEGEFVTDGLYPSAFAARHLASAGFLSCRSRRGQINISKPIHRTISTDIEVRSKSWIKRGSLTAVESDLLALVGHAGTLSTL